MIVVPRERIDAFLHTGAWTERRLDEDFDAALAAHPEREAVLDPPNRETLHGGAPRRATYRELDRMAHAFGARLLERGLRKDDVLCMQLANGVEQVAAFLACMRLGIVLTPVAVQYREHELSHLLAVSGAKAVLTAPLAGFEHPALFRSLGAQTLFGLEDFAGEGDEAAVRAAQRENPPSAHDVVTLCWTSGTEGTPKGVPRNHNEWRVIGEGVAGSVELGEGVRLLNPFPLTNMGGIGGLLVPWLLRGGTLVQHHPFALPVFLQQLRQERVDYTVAPPALLNMLLQRAELLEGVDFARLRSLGSGSAPLSEWMVRAFAERFGVQVVNYFGSNEGTALMSTPADLADPAQRASYFPRMGVAGFAWRHPLASMLRTRLVEPATGEVLEEPGRAGELRIAGASIFSGYYRQPELTAAAFDEEGYFRTGDLFEIAGERRELYRFVGRLKDLILRGGVNISAEEVETLLVEHPGVAEVALVGYPDAILGERACAVVVPRKDAPEPTLESLCAFLRDVKKVAVFKLPERLELVPALPRNPMNKVLKSELRARLR